MKKMQLFLVDAHISLMTSDTPIFPRRSPLLRLQSSVLLSLHRHVRAVHSHHWTVWLKYLFKRDGGGGSDGGEEGK